MATNKQGSTNFSRLGDRRKSRSQGKKPLPEPTHLGHFIMIVVMKLCKKILLADTSVKIGVYLIGVMIGSVFADLTSLPPTYFSNKRNIFNVFFVKVGWGWTCCALAVHIGLTSYIYSLGKWNLVRVHLLRLVLATFWWYSVTSLISYIESLVGVCSETVHPSRMACTRAGKAWLGFDISGHVFLLIHNLLTISEEVRFFKDWSKLESIIADEDLATDRNFKREDVSNTKEALKTMNIYVKLNIMLLAFLTILWEFMLIISTVYRFHTLSQKVAAAFISVGCWFVSYRVILRAKSFLLRPGESPLRFTKLD